MSMFLHWLTSPEWTQIVKALLHSLWQGALIAAVLAIGMRRLTNAVSRYRCSLVALAVLMVASIVTWAAINASSSQSPAVTLNHSVAEQSQTTTDFVTTVASNDADKIIVTADRPPALASIHWTGWIALAWLLGTGLMLIRACTKVAGAEKLRRSCQPLNDARITELLVEARRVVGLSRQVRLAATEKLTSPAVVGLLVPTLILPLSLITTLTPEQIRFVLLHELAHIRRGDYLANLFQLFAESLLFFNPAIWWISHQMRREREACCDALAIELSGAPADYARTLVRVAENILRTTPTAALAFGNEREPSSLADRVQRLLVPGYRPSLRLTWRAMLGALALGSVLLVLSAVGTRMTVAAILTPQQRIERIEKKMAEYGGSIHAEEFSLDATNAPKVKVSGHVRTADSSPLPKVRWLTVYYSRKNSGGVSGTRVQTNGAFTTEAILGGRLSVGAETPGFAPTIAGPVSVDSVKGIENLDLVLERGFEVPIFIADAETEKPVAGASLKAQFWVPEMGSSFGGDRKLKTDSSGKTVMTNCSTSVALTLAVNASGYEITDQTVEKLNPQEPIRIKLKRGQTLSGVVLNKADDTPLAGATVRMIYEQGQMEQHYQWTDMSRVLATTDANGRFIVNQLNGATKYWLGVSAPGHESALVGPVTSATKETTVKLGPELVVRGRVLGSLEGLQIINQDYCLSRNYSEVFENHSNGFQEWLPVHVTDGAATFQFTNPIPGLVRLAGRQGFHDERAVTAPMNDWVVDLSTVEKQNVDNRPKREVIFRFKNSSVVPPRGTVSVTAPDSLEKNHLTAHEVEMEITNGEVRAEIAIGGRTSIEAKHMVGYWFKHDFGGCVVTNGVGPMVIEIPLVPAGAIYAKALNADGTAAGGLMFGVVELKRSPARGASSSLDSGNDSFSGNQPRKWVSGPLPLGGIYQIYGSRGNSFCVSKPITLTEETPDAEVELQFTAGQTLEGILVDADGRPLRNVDVNPFFTLLVSRDNTHSFGLKSVATDEQGKFRIEKATPGVGEFSAVVNAPGIMAERVRLDFTGHPQMIRLKRGQTLAGQVLDQDTGYVIPGAEVRALDFGNDRLPLQRAQTDSNGRFEFTTLGNVEYTLYVADTKMKTEKKVYADGSTNITLKVEPYEWSKLKPKPPERQGTANAAVPKTNADTMPVNTNVSLSGHTTSQNIATNEARRAMLRKLEAIRLNSVHYDKLPLSVVFSNLAQNAKVLDANKQGVHFILSADIKSVPITIRPALANMRLLDVLDAIVKASPEPIHYSIEDYAVIFSPGQEGGKLYVREFKINPDVFLPNLRKEAGLTDTNLETAGQALRKMFSEAGAALQPPKSMFLNEKGSVLIRAALKDFGPIESIVQKLNYVPPLINMKTTFITLPDTLAQSLMQGFSVTNRLTNGGFSVVLTVEETKRLLKRCKQESKANVLVAPEVTTLNGRQAQVQITDITTIVMGLESKALIAPGIMTTNESDVYRTKRMELGPLIDLFPRVSSDGYSIDLTAIPSVTEFLGYDKSVKDVVIYVNGKKLTTPPPLPRLRTQKMFISATVFDGDTLVLGGAPWLETVTKPDGTTQTNAVPDSSHKQLFVLVTPRLIDAMGNVIHAEN